MSGDHSILFPVAEERAKPIGLTTAAGIELALVKFITRLFKYAALDNEAVNQIPDAPDEGLERIMWLPGKKPPEVYAGYIPLTITGEIDPEAIPDYPSIVVSGQGVRHGWDLGILEVQILGGTYDQGKTRGGRVDCMNLMEAMTEAFFAFPSFGEVGVLAGKDRASTPLEWHMQKTVGFSHYFALMTLLLEQATPTNYLRNPVFKVPYR